jgi:hypothetical protein
MINKIESNDGSLDSEDKIKIVFEKLWEDYIYKQESEINF